MNLTVTKSDDTLIDNDYIWFNFSSIKHFLSKPTS